MSKASDFLNHYILFIPEKYKHPHTKYGPGQVVMQMSNEKRELLQSLKSEDLQNMRPDACSIFSR